MGPGDSVPQLAAVQQTVRSSLASDCSSHQDELEWLCTSREDDGHPFAVIGETVHEARNMEAVLFVEADGAIVPLQYEQHVLAPWLQP
jgi:hypothetical protein